MFIITKLGIVVSQQVEEFVLPVRPGGGCQWRGEFGGGGGRSDRDVTAADWPRANMAGGRQSINWLARGGREVVGEGPWCSGEPALQPVSVSRAVRELVESVASRHEVCHSHRQVV